MTAELTSGIERAWFARPHGDDGWAGIHGLAHTVRVRTHARALALAIGLSDDERAAVDRAAMWHDIGRTNDRADYYHGAKSAGKVVGLGLELAVTRHVADLALFAVTHHSGSEAHALRAAALAADPDSTLRVFLVLKDADALDRVRIGDLDIGYLRFPESHALVDAAWELYREFDPPRVGTLPE